MTTAEIAAVASAAVAAVAALVGLVINIARSKPDLLKVAADTKNVEATAESVHFTTVRSLLDDLNTMRQQLHESRLREDECASLLDSTIKQLADVIARITVLENALPPMVIGGKMKMRAASVQRVLNRSHDGIVLTSTVDGGTIIWVSDAFARWLGRDQLAFIAIPWRTLVHPDDLAKSNTAETSAWRDSGEVVNRWLHADGRWISLRWHFSAYDDESALSIVWLEQTAPESST